MLELAVLGLLKEQQLHGYELKKRLTEALGPFSSVSFGSLYPALNRLEAAGAVRAVEAVVEAGGRRAAPGHRPHDRLHRRRGGRLPGPAGGVPRPPAERAPLGPHPQGLRHHRPGPAALRGAARGRDGRRRRRQGVQSQAGVLPLPAARPAAAAARAPAGPAGGSAGPHPHQHAGPAGPHGHVHAIADRSRHRGRRAGHLVARPPDRHRTAGQTRSGQSRFEEDSSEQDDSAGHRGSRQLRQLAGAGPRVLPRRRPGRDRPRPHARGARRLPRA